MGMEETSMYIGISNCFGNSSVDEAEDTAERGIFGYLEDNLGY